MRQQTDRGRIGDPLSAGGVEAGPPGEAGFAGYEREFARRKAGIPPGQRGEPENGSQEWLLFRSERRLITQAKLVAETEMLPFYS